MRILDTQRGLIQRPRFTQVHPLGHVASDRIIPPGHEVVRVSFVKSVKFVQSEGASDLVWFGCGPFLLCIRLVAVGIECFCPESETWSGPLMLDCVHVPLLLSLPCLVALGIVHQCVGIRNAFAPSLTMQHGKKHGNPL